MKASAYVVTSLPTHEINLFHPPIFPATQTFHHWCRCSLLRSRVYRQTSSTVGRCWRKLEATWPQAAPSIWVAAVVTTTSGEIIENNIAYLFISSLYILHIFTHSCRHLFVLPSVRPSVCLSVRSLVSSSFRPSVCLSVRPSVSVCPSICLSVRPSVRSLVSSSFRPSVCLSVRPSVRLSVCPSICLFVRSSVRSFVHPFFR